MSRLSEHAEKIIETVETYAGTSAIVASWRRCLRVHGLDPDQATPPAADREAWHQACRREAMLIEVACPALDQLYAMLNPGDCAVFLTDRTGMALDLRTSRACDVWQREPKDWLGAAYSEEKLGTTGIGMCLADQRVVVVRGDQHFMTRYVNRVWIAAPLFGPSGSLVGSISFNQDIALHDQRVDSFFAMTLANFARRIEAELFARAFPQTRLVLASPQGRSPEALLAVDHDDRVIGATRAARRLLSLDDDALAEAPNLDELFNATAGRRVDVLADAERRTILRALSRVGGNLSAAARLVGISRSTLYRKLAAYEIGVPMAPPRPRPSA
ncbi:putative Fis family transcriptional regulator [Beijerinckiaceae bacterium RH AL1]|nr:GAF domain-containing protein [Beijerinckiaceae bacterium]VVB47947.1 putative Fis family transcriptional regulator [Beijerinckiaceae bacterium RH CH11]VVB48024.1 putative Fis family transcriptional regulator [Beijerinckiaceae bacterium RH AL8]VVC56144.1 putative Fis family transcriptional regulator [Beijerinckiaceae bacterium RH AL1]